jgi:glycosyltransferase involved in cell wall biosynthesis
MKPKVSLIIPAYNVEKYIAECLEAAVTQTLEDIEIIILNDGSTDKTEMIINKYAERDQRIVAVSHENMGLSATRNKGAAMASGEYLYFYDSDDFIDPYAMEILYKAASTNDLSIVFGNKVIFYENEYTYEAVQARNTGMSKESVKLLDPVAFIADLAVYDVVVWRYLYRKDFWKQLIFGFAEGQVYEDSEFTPKCVLSADCIGVVDYPIYYYRKRSQAFTMSGMDAKKLNSLVVNADRLAEFCYSWEGSEERKKYVNREIGNFVIQAAANFHLYQTMLEIDLSGWLKKRSKNLLDSPKSNHRLVGWGLSKVMYLTIFSLRLRYHFVYQHDRKMMRNRINCVEV